MPELQGQPAEVRFTLSIKRAATGLTDTFDMVGKILPEGEAAAEAATAPAPATAAIPDPQTFGE